MEPLPLCGHSTLWKEGLSEHASMARALCRHSCALVSSRHSKNQAVGDRTGQISPSPRYLPEERGAELPSNMASSVGVSPNLPHFGGPFTRWPPMAVHIKTTCLAPPPTPPVLPGCVRNR
ncbi:hypothetical protein KIL84_002091 [Mauremys mutica]|uniref:Uncharacterized protein n=1 Tax=Mauremys mutica TaxID=74926 RepID=A0A9D3XK40_9SAUR|nr:hypothetical protein KIL84_002091 [Mauremys mutica]